MTNQEAEQIRQLKLEIANQRVKSSVFGFLMVASLAVVFLLDITSFEFVLCILCAVVSHSLKNSVDEAIKQHEVVIREIETRDNMDRFNEPSCILLPNQIQSRRSELHFIPRSHLQADLH